MSRSNLLILKGLDSKFCSKSFRGWNYFFTRKKHYDIAISGGGMVGTAMACAIASNPKLSEKSVVLFESSPNKPSAKSANDDYSNRVVSLTPGTRKFLESLGVWKHIEDVRYKTVKKLQVWDSYSDALITFNDDLENDVSFIVENDVILYSLQQVTSQFKENIDIKYECKIKNAQLPLGMESAKVELENGDKYTCDLLIGADGANSQLRQILGCQYLSWSYKQKGIVATLKLSEPTENVVAWQRFLPTGPVALLPVTDTLTTYGWSTDTLKAVAGIKLTDELSSLVWSTGIKEADVLLQLSDESFVDAINDAFWKTYPQNVVVTSATQYLNKVLETLNLNSSAVRQLPPSISSVQPKSRAAFPLGFGYSTKYVGPRLALVGDAAHRVHPLSGQGVNLGFKDVECLVRKLAEAVYDGERLGLPTTLSAYQSERQLQLIPMLVAIDGLHKLYTTTFTPVVLARSLGLQITHAISPLKKLIMHRASV